MVTPTGARDFFPRSESLTAYREAASRCRGCELWKLGAQTVFGEGRAGSRVLMVGEQPGFEEDKAGKPFVGPAGRILNDGLAAAGIARSDAYVTNVVKHFKWVAMGKRHIHKKPNAREIGACLPWLEKEIEFVKPEVVVCLGATAAQALLGRDFRVSVQHGQPVPTSFARHAVATLHPSSILRQQTPEERHAAMDEFVSDLRIVAGLLT